MFKVIKAFFDLEDKNRYYEVGDLFPRKGLEVSEERIEELASKNNKQGKPLIEKVADETPVDETPVDETVDETVEPADETPKKKGGKK